MEVLRIVADKPADQTRIFFGAWVRLEDENGNQRRYRIVGADEIDPASNHISLDSPMARALLGKSVGDEFTVELPEGRSELLVTEVSYADRMEP